MINQFLATLDNIATAPYGFLWPTFTPRVLGDVEASVRAALIGVNLSREETFSRCLILTDLVAQSPLASYITAADPRLTYSRAAISSRFAVSGPIIQYTGSNAHPAAPTLQLLPTTPDIDAWTLQPLSSSSLSIVDDRGGSDVVTVTFSGGVSNPVALPGLSGQVQFMGTSMDANDSWQITYRAPGATWTAEALARMATIDPRSLMNDDILAWYNSSLLQLDKLAATIAALGTA